MINIAVLGYGTVGSGVVEVINKNHASINKRAGQEVNIKYVLDLRDFPGDPVEKVLVHDYSVIVNDPEVKIIVEVMGGIKPAYDFTRQALEAGKSVCTSNKELVAAHGAELLAIAKANNVNFLFEASVGGGIPIIRPLNQSLTADEITEITGILNGTTNYILSKMTDEGKSFEEVLKRAQEKGYAERNPEADVEGHDACRKICILAALAFGRHVYPQYVKTEGISGITLEDVAYAESDDCVIKLLGRAKRVDDVSAYVFVGPHLVSKESPLACVNGVFNSIMVSGNEIGDVMFYGRGAGKYPTASAVVADVIDAVKHIHARKFLSWDDAGAEVVSDISSFVSRSYIRVSGESVRSAVCDAFGEVRFLERSDAPSSECAFITPELSQSELSKKLEKLGERCKVLSNMMVL